MAVVPRAATPLSEGDSIRFFLQRYLHAFGRLPTRRKAAGLMTLLWHETGRGRSIIQHNWGNLAAPATSLSMVDYWEPEWVDDDLIAELPEGARKRRLENLRAQAENGQAPVAFRAFGSHEEGADAWLALLQRDHLRHILSAASRGPKALWRAVAWPNPRLQGSTMSYCPHCRSKAVLEQYAKLYTELLGREELSLLEQSSSPWLGLGLASAFAGGIWLWKQKKGDA